MGRLRTMKLESSKLEVFEVERRLQEYITGKGLKADIQKNDNCFNIYLSDYSGEEDRQELSESSLLTFFNKLKLSEEAEVVKTEYGYKIVMGPDIHDSKLMETYRNEKSNAYTCFICESIQHGAGNDPWPISNNPTHRVCDKCSEEFVLTERRELLNKAKGKIEEAEEQVDKASIEHEASNEVLDDKFVWVFSVLDARSETIEDNISTIQDAIDTLVDRDGTFLVAFPYVDPNPEEPSVDLVPADNPGPVVLYNKEDANLPKNKLSNYELEDQPKREESLTESGEEDIRYSVILNLIHYKSGKDIEIGYDIFNAEDEEEAIEIAKDSVRKDYPDYHVSVKEVLSNINESTITEDSHEQEQEKLVAAITYIHAYFKANQEIAKNIFKEGTCDKVNDVLVMFTRMIGKINAYKTKNPEVKEEATITEALDDDFGNFRVNINFTQIYYDMYDSEDSGMEISQYNDNYIKALENISAEQLGIFIDFDYIGTVEVDYASNEFTYAEANRFKENFEDEHLEITIQEMEVK